MSRVKRPILNYLNKSFPAGKNGKWVKSSGLAVVRKADGSFEHVIVHWFENDKVGQVGWKVKDNVAKKGKQ